LVWPSVVDATAAVIEFLIARYWRRALVGDGESTRPEASVAPRVLASGSGYEVSIGGDVADRVDLVVVLAVGEGRSAQMHKTIASLSPTEFPNLTEFREVLNPSPQASSTCREYRLTPGS